jgi:hypothetical protein
MKTKAFVIGESLCGKTPFSIEVALACRLHHIEAGNWLRRHVASGEFAAMLHDPEWMDRIVLQEQSRKPNECVDYVRARLIDDRPALIDGLFDPDDFQKLFDVTRDEVVHLIHTQSVHKPTTHERGLEAIQICIRALQDAGTLTADRIHVYTYPAFRRGKTRDKMAVHGSVVECSSLEAAVGHFIAYAKASPKYQIEPQTT